MCRLTICQIQQDLAINETRGIGNRISDYIYFCHVRLNYGKRACLLRCIYIHMYMFISVYVVLLYSI